MSEGSQRKVIIATALEYYQLIFQPAAYAHNQG